MKKINVVYTLHEKEETVTIPVTYTSEQTGKRQVLKCEVELPEEKLPDWLKLKTFEVPIIHDEMVTSTHYSD